MTDERNCWGILKWSYALDKVYISDTSSKIDLLYFMQSYLWSNPIGQSWTAGNIRRDFWHEGQFSKLISCHYFNEYSESMLVRDGLWNLYTNRSLKYLLIFHLVLLSFKFHFFFASLVFLDQYVERILGPFSGSYSELITDE